MWVRLPNIYLGKEKKLRIMNPFNFPRTSQCINLGTNPLPGAAVLPSATSSLLASLETFSSAKALPVQVPQPRKKSFLMSFLSFTLTLWTSSSLALKMLLQGRILGNTRLILQLGTSHGSTAQT